MSFISVLKGIEKGLGIALPFATNAAAILYPPAAPWLAKLNNLTQTLHSSVIATEANNPLDGQGGLKSNAVNNDLNAYIDTMNAGLAFEKKMLQDDKALRQAAIDATVAAYNADAVWQKTFKVVDLPAGA